MAPAHGAEFMAKFVEGTHYQRIPIPVQTEPTPAGKVEVVEVFSYGCIHCYNFDPMIEGWHKAQNEVAFRLVPSVFNDSW